MKDGQFKNEERDALVWPIVPMIPWLVNFWKYKLEVQSNLKLCSDSILSNSISRGVCKGVSESCLSCDISIFLLQHKRIQIGKIYIFSPIKQCCILQKQYVYWDPTYLTKIKVNNTFTVDTIALPIEVANFLHETNYWATYHLRCWSRNLSTLLTHSLEDALKFVSITALFKRLLTLSFIG